MEGRERFFRAIAERIDVERVEEVHVFPAIRQGGRESGVAVLTLRPEPTESEIAAEAEAAQDAIDQGDDGSFASADTSAGVDATVEGEYAGDAPDADAFEEEEEEDDGDIVDAGDDVACADGDDGEVDVAAYLDAGEALVEPLLPPPPPRRFTVLRAHYRLQLKGPDRGKWEVAVVEEADAPSATVDEVVRGVHERAGGWSVEGPERLTGDEFRAALAEEPWSATR